MATRRSHATLVMGVPVLVTHPDRVTHTRRDSMSSTTDQGHQGHHPPVHPPTDARGPEGPLYVTPETEDSFEEIER
jgi:hypothetical protein